MFLGSIEPKVWAKANIQKIHFNESKNRIFN